MVQYAIMCRAEEHLHLVRDIRKPTPSAEDAGE